MSETHSSSYQTIAQELVLARIQRHDEMRQFFLTMYEQNPLSGNAGKRINDLLTPFGVLQQRPEFAKFKADIP